MELRFAGRQHTRRAAPRHCFQHLRGVFADGNDVVLDVPLLAFTKRRDILRRDNEDRVLEEELGEDRLQEFLAVDVFGFFGLAERDERDDGVIAVGRGAPRGRVGEATRIYFLAAAAAAISRFDIFARAEKKVASGATPVALTVRSQAQ